MDPSKLFQIITNSTLLATRLLPASGSSPLEFSSRVYSTTVAEVCPISTTVTTVTATHIHGAEVRYSITGGNIDGLFSIDQRSGTITLAAALDRELCDKYEMKVSAEGGGVVTVAVVQVRVGDVNDNAPVFLRPQPRLTLIEEDDRDLPATVAKVEVVDADESDAGRLAFQMSGDGVAQDPGHDDDAFFTINARTGDLILLRALDRDPPHGRGVWRLRVEVRDGQWWEEGEEFASSFPNEYFPAHPHRQASWGHQDPDLGLMGAKESHGNPRGKSGAQRGERGGESPDGGHRNKKHHVLPSRSDADIYRHGQAWRLFNERPKHKFGERSTPHAGNDDHKDARYHDPGTQKPASPPRHNNEGRQSTASLDSHGEDKLLRNYGKTLRSGSRCGEDRESPAVLRGQPVHVVETVVTIVVKDINDNAPLFPNTTMKGHVQENGAAGEAVVVVSAWDADDAQDGTNARLTYYIEKNVIDEDSGAAIFSVEPRTGLVRTALCCLDRETTPEYHIQVVAVDGGGLKGTGTVVVRVTDVNDNAPRLARRHWELEVEETPATVPLPNTTLLELSAADRDAQNTFFFRVVPESGHGWEHFRMRSMGALGHLVALRNLDFEQETHRRGFKFMVQVTDQDSRGWEDLDHVDSAWVTIHLKDVNDNPPAFSRPHAHVTVREDAAPSTALAALPAHDPDMVRASLHRQR